MLLTLFAGIALLTIAANQGILPKGNTIVFLLFFGIVVLLVIYMMRLTSFAKVEVTLDDNSISIKWREQFLFSNKQDITIPFSEIASYVDQSDSHWDWLKMEFTNGTVYRIWHSNLMSKDDYSKFVSAFVSSVKNYNKVVKKTSVKEGLETKIIKRSKSIYETSGGLILAVFAVAIIVGAPILLLAYPPKGHTNYFALGAGYCGAIYFVVQVYLQRRRDKSDD